MCVLNSTFIWCYWYLQCKRYIRFYGCNRFFIPIHPAFIIILYVDINLINCFLFQTMYNEIRPCYIWLCMHVSLFYYFVLCGQKWWNKNVKSIKCYVIIIASRTNGNSIFCSTATFVPPRRTFIRYPLHGVPFKTWINLKSCMDCIYIHHWAWNEITYQFPNFSVATVGVWEWIHYSTHTFQGKWLLSILALQVITFYTGIKVNPC